MLRDFVREYFWWATAVGGAAVITLHVRRYFSGIRVGVLEEATLHAELRSMQDKLLLIAALLAILIGVCSGA